MSGGKSLHLQNKKINIQVNVCACLCAHTSGRRREGGGEREREGGREGERGQERTSFHKAGTFFTIVMNCFLGSEGNEAWGRDL